MYKSLNLKEFVDQNTFNIVYDEQQKAAAVLIPITHWRPERAAELKQLMEQLIYTPVFDCSSKELECRLRPEIEKIEAENIDQGLYNIYEPAGDLPKQDHVVRSYADHAELIKVNSATGNSQVINRKL